MSKKNLENLSKSRAYFMGHQKVTPLIKRIGNKETVWGCLVEDRKKELNLILKEKGLK